MQYRRLVVIILTILFSSELFAEMGKRTAAIEKIQAESANRVGYENILYIKQLGSWSATSCNTTWAAFNAQENPHLMSIALAARVSQMPVTVTVDDTYPKLGSICQIINIEM